LIDTLNGRGGFKCRAHGAKIRRSMAGASTVSG
jgi:hypothetical protein